MPPSTTAVKMRKSGPSPRLGSNEPCSSAEHEAGQPGQGAGQDPDVDGDALDVDAGHRGQVAVVGDGPHLLAQAGAGEEEGDQRRHRQRDHDSDRLPRREADDAQLDHLRLADAVAAHLRAGDDEDHVADQQAEPDADEGDGDGAPPPQGAEQPEVGGDGEEGDGGHRPRGGDKQMQTERDIDDEGGKGPDRQEVAVGEVGDALDAEDQRRADAGQGQDGAGDQPVDDELGELSEVSVGHGGQLRTAAHRTRGRRPPYPARSPAAVLGERSLAMRVLSFRDAIRPRMARTQHPSPHAWEGLGRGVAADAVPDHNGSGTGLARWTRRALARGTGSRWRNPGHYPSKLIVSTISPVASAPSCQTS